MVFRCLINIQNAMKCTKDSAIFHICWSTNTKDFFYCYLCADGEI